MIKRSCRDNSPEGLFSTPQFLDVIARRPVGCLECNAVPRAAVHGVWGFCQLPAGCKTPSRLILSCICWARPRAIIVFHCACLSRETHRDGAFRSFTVNIKSPRLSSAAPVCPGPESPPQLFDFAPSFGHLPPVVPARTNTSVDKGISHLPAQCLTSRLASFWDLWKYLLLTFLVTYTTNQAW